MAFTHRAPLRLPTMCAPLRRYSKRVPRRRFLTFSTLARRPANTPVKHLFIGHASTSRLLPREKRRPQSSPIHEWVGVVPDSADGRGLIQQTNNVAQR